MNSKWYEVHDKEIEYNHSTRSIILDEVVKKDFSGQDRVGGVWYFNRMEGGKAMQITKERTFQAKAVESAKALRPKHAQSVLVSEHALEHTVSLRDGA